MKSEPSAPIDSAESLREALHKLRLEHAALARSSAHAQHLLDALEGLLGLQPDDDPFERVFASLRKVFTFAQVLLLAEPGTDTATLNCIAADPPALIGSRWPAGPLFAKVLNGRVVTTFSHADVAEWRGAAALGLAPVQAALYAPVRVRSQRGILVLLAPSGAEGFDRDHVILARRFAVLTSHALATRVASQSAAEERRLLDLTAQLQHSQQAAQRNADLLNEVVDALPLALTVQDAAGRLLIVNDLAAAVLGQPAAALRGTMPFADDADPAGVERRLDHCQSQLRDGEQREREFVCTIDNQPRTFLVTGKPVRIFDEMLLVSASLDITERKRLEEDLSRRAFHDQLTGLPNRALMAQRVDHALRARAGGGMFALAFIDLDNFKQVNDYYSHATGDALLVAVARRIRNNIRPGDTLARISGDEFLLLIDPLYQLADLAPVIERVVTALKQPFVVDGHELLTSASVGASVFPLHGATDEALRRCADSAMYRAKHQRKGTAGYFDQAMDCALSARTVLTQELRSAVRERRFRTAFQPKVDLHTGRIAAFEALVRWVEPNGSVRMPGGFIELAGELGLLDEITRFVLDDVVHALPQLVRWYGAGVSVSINLGARQSGDAAFMESFVALLAASGAAGHMVLELTEDAVVATRHFEHEVLPALRALGVRVSIDDFGTGYSSLSKLADITADEVKIDRAFITSIHERPRSQGILRAIESLCAALDISVVAEGVETVDELAYLRRHTSIRLAQGYLFARPVFLDALAPLEPAVPMSLPA